MSKRIMIVGTGQAGVQVAVSLRQGGFDEEIVMVGAETHVPYQRPPLSKQVLKKEWAAERCQLRHLEFYQDHDIELLQGTRATRLDTGGSNLELDDGSVWHYDALALCTGSRLNRLNMDGGDLPEVRYLRTVDDALDLSGRLQPDSRLVVIGGGYIGLEVAAAARGLGADVTVIEALDQVMQRSALPEIAAFLRRRHEDAGVSFVMGARVSHIVGDGRVEAVELEDGRQIPADVVMVGVGVRPDLRLVEGSGVETARGVRVDGGCRTNVENVFAAGDVAESAHPLLDGWHVLESVQNAVSQGKIVAANMLGRDETYSEVPWFWSEQYDSRLQMAGIPRTSDRHVFRANPDTGGMSVFCVAGDYVSAVQCIDSPRDYMVGRQLISNRTTVQDAPLADHHFNLKELL
ncbi:NAD(P)/FAD-dependent oxidoreductase [Elongatibacter sediminis]|uniref:FAD-dependent oxidoreductase n=1 Tax=Elongatibacter sediminis TaxID=3119006 RepID=A0AAW9R805_9GAMM